MLYSQALICLHRSFKPLRSEMTFSFKRQDAYGVGSFDDISIQTVSKSVKVTLNMGRSS